MTIQKVNHCGTSKAAIIPKDFFLFWAQKGKTFHEIRVLIAEDMERIVIVPILEDIKKEGDNK